MACFALLLVATRYARLNLSPSLPYGLYRLQTLPPVLTRGTLVLLPAPVVIHPWWPWYVPLLKPVAGVPGDTVCVAEHTLVVNGVDYGVVYQEAHGMPLPQIAEGCVFVPPGAVFLGSRVPKSLDGRYLGMTPVAALTAQAVPLWTWR